MLQEKNKSYLQDTPHFLRTIEEINSGPKLPLNSILVVIDIIGAYQNIPHEDGINCLEDTLESENKSGFTSRLMEILLKYNLFTFNKEYFQQLIGVSSPKLCKYLSGK